MTGSRRRGLGMDGVDLLVLVLFACVVALAAWTVLMSGPETAASVLLLAGLTGFVALGFLVFRGGRPVAGAALDGDERLVTALEEPAAVAAVDGRIRSANRAWLDLVGPAVRLPRAPSQAPGLFQALSEARRGGVGRAALRMGGVDRPAVVSAAGSRRRSRACG